MLIHFKPHIPIHICQAKIRLNELNHVVIAHNNVFDRLLIKECNKPEQIKFQMARIAGIVAIEELLDFLLVLRSDGTNLLRDEANV